MQMPGIPANGKRYNEQYTGLIHFAVSTCSKEKVDALTEDIRQAGYTVAGEPRWTGDGYYESVVTDPDITVSKSLFKVKGLGCRV